MFVKTDSQNNILTYPYSIDMFRQENMNVSFPSDISNRLLASYNVYPVQLDVEPEHDKITQYVYPAETPEYIEGVWKLSLLVGQKDDAQLAMELEQQKNKIRDIRDTLLTKSDWVIIRSIDINMPVEPEWATYRQSLREVTRQEGFPWNVIWPTDPTGFTYTE